jgi:hypothetical protein
MKNEKLAVVVIPLYKSVLSYYEEVSIFQCLKILSNYKIVAIKPKALSLDLYKMKFDDVISLDDDLFENIAGYNKLMLLASFYKRFLDYSYMLVYQPDAFVFNDELSYWCNQGFDYIGAPWLRFGGYPDIVKKYKTYFLRYIHTKLNLKQANTDLPTDLQTESRVGNGGFSLRNVSKFYDVCIKQQTTIDYYNSRPEYYFGEDVFWSVEANRYKEYIRIPNYEIAAAFSIENNPEDAFKLTHNKMPFGCHAWDRNLGFWSRILAEYGVTF